LSATRYDGNVGGRNFFVRSTSTTSVYGPYVTLYNGTHNTSVANFDTLANAVIEWLPNNSTTKFTFKSIVGNGSMQTFAMSFDTTGLMFSPFLAWLDW
jgi:hypothetical protein